VIFPKLREVACSCRNAPEFDLRPAHFLNLSVVLTVIGALLIAASTTQMATAAGRHARKAQCAPAPAAQQFRNAYGAVVWPFATPSDLSDYSEGHVISAPAGH
jgi:hypothetical protein